MKKSGVYLKKKEFDNLILEIKPCKEITKTPMSIDDLAFWTASDLLYFVLYYSPVCLKKLLPKKYYEHWLLLTLALNKFLKTKITDTDYDQASTALKKFVSDIEIVYKESDDSQRKMMRFNVHCLLHIPKLVKLYGAIWVWSAFPYESFIGDIRKFVTGKQYMGEQICKKFLRLMHIKSQMDRIFVSEQFSPNVAHLLKKLLRNSGIKVNVPHTGMAKGLSHPKHMQLQFGELIEIRNFLGYDVHDIALTYDVFVTNNIVFHSINYQRLQKRNNSVAKVTGGKFVEITNFILVKREDSGDTDQLILDHELAVVRNDFSISPSDRNLKQEHAIVKKTENLKVLSVMQIEFKCVLVPMWDDKLAVFPLPNIYERD